MGRFGSGLERAIGEVIGGFITYAFFMSFVESGAISPFLFALLSIIGILVLIKKMPYWSTAYLIGWVIGLLIFIQSGLIGFIELLILIGMPLIILLKRNDLIDI